eukprot:TRINITY_DN17545_c0_g2_i1.p1 TRINITY_DN17545_c0_g2~~TRINITY_DN17545_c0_g2_i1.p1  ORF type:complete len:522 (+),score=76.59 TRINITY_DN17545_c0_g2_i1:166-1566(+)
MAALFSAWTFAAPDIVTGSKSALVSSRADRLRGHLLHAEAESAPEASPAPEFTYSSVSQSTANLIKNIVGCGVMSLPAGVAAFSGSTEAALPAFLIVVFFGLLSAYGFVNIADACRRTGEVTYRGAWSKTVGEGSAWLPAVACLSKAFATCLAYAMIIGDCLSRITFLSRSSSILVVTAAILFPLTLLKSLAPLAKFSLVGVMSNVYICFFVVLRCLDGSYAPGGAFAAAAPALPKFAAAASSAMGTVMNPGALTLICMLGTAFVCHYNAPMFYEQLEPEPNGEKSDRFFKMSVAGFSGAALIFAIIMVAGFWTFGLNCQGLILNNYAETDALAGLARVGVCLSLILGFPLSFLSLRKDIVAMLGKSGEDFAAKQPILLTVMLHAVITALALNLYDLGKVVAIAGSCFGSILIYIAPSLMVLRAQQRGVGAKLPEGAAGATTRGAQMLCIAVGLAFGILGTVRNLS